PALAGLRPALRGAGPPGAAPPGTRAQHHAARDHGRVRPDHQSGPRLLQPDPDPAARRLARLLPPAPTTARCAVPRARPLRDPDPARDHALRTGRAPGLPGPGLLAPGAGPHSDPVLDLMARVDAGDGG